ncbi:MAG: hypothetical protein RL885_02630 [Planctomycetota bacterium]
MRAFLILVTSALLLSCSTTSQEYVEEARGFAITQGRIVRVDGLSSRKYESLADGVAIRVDGEPCRVTVDFGGKNKELELPDGSILLLSEERGYVLQPHQGTEPVE